MVVDTSAVVTILLGEPGTELFVRVMDEADSLQMSVASALETGTVIESRSGAAARRTFDAWLESSGIEIIPVTRAQVEAARQGFREYGKGRHPAGLNFGDCFSYGLAKVLGETLLFRGLDFSKTDIRAAIKTFG